MIAPAAHRTLRPPFARMSSRDAPWLRRSIGSSLASCSRPLAPAPAGLLLRIDAPAPALRPPKPSSPSSSSSMRSEKMAVCPHSLARAVRARELAADDTLKVITTQQGLLQTSGERAACWGSDSLRDKVASSRLMQRVQKTVRPRACLHVFAGSVTRSAPSLVPLALLPGLLLPDVRQQLGIGLRHVLCHRIQSTALYQCLDDGPDLLKQCLRIKDKTRSNRNGCFVHRLCSLAKHANNGTAITLSLNLFFESFSHSRTPSRMALMWGSSCQALMRITMTW